MQNRVVMVTGGFGTLGRAVARAFESQGAKVAVVDRSAIPPGDSSSASDRLLKLENVDLTRYPDAITAVQRVTAYFGRLDVLVNIAGGFVWQTLADGDPENWDRMYAINLKTAVMASKAALPALLESGAGRVINIGAGAAAKAGAGMGAYTASKSGVQRLTESLAEELKDRGVTVNAVLPGIIDTAQNRADMPKADHSRWVAPEAIADVILFIASDAARAVTGAAIPVFGRG
jgi:NAD(P)-dependent dehydrogenase (short-subunit alcohol dehydrogenase family)